MVTEDRPHGPRKPIEMVLTDTFYPGSNLANPGWDPAGDGGPDCPFCGVEMSSSACRNEDCPGEVLQCEVITFHGSPNPDSAMFGQDERCENDVEPGSTVCAAHAYEVDEPSFTSEARRD